MQKIILFFLLVTSLFAKSSDFSIIVDEPFNDALFDVVEDYDRVVTAVGFSRDFTSSLDDETTFNNAFDYLDSISSSYGLKMHLLKVGQYADIQIHKPANMQKFSKAVSVLKTPTDGYFIGGYTLDGSLIIQRLSSNANIIFSKSFGTKNYDKMSSLIELGDGGVLAIGSSMSSRDPYGDKYTSGLGLNDIFVTRFTKDGRILWSKKYGTDVDDVGVSGVEASDGSIIIIGSTADKQNKDISIMRITQNGDKIWLKRYGEKELLTPYKIIQLRDSNFLLSLSYTDEMKKQKVRLLKFDLQQNILIEKNIQTTYSSGLRDIEEYSDGGIIGVGFVRDKLNTDGLVMLFDATLEMQNQEHYGEQNYDTFNAVAILHDSTAAVAGVYTYKNSQESNMWIAKLNRDATMVQVVNKTKRKKALFDFTTANFEVDLSKSSNDANDTDDDNSYVSSKLFETSNGFVSPIDFTSSSNITKSSNNYPSDKTLYNQLILIFADEISSKKIAIKEDLSIYFLQSALYFKVGRYILSSKQKELLDNFFKKLMPFLEQYKSSIFALEVNGHASSEWGGTNFTQRFLRNEKLSMNRAYSVVSYIFPKQKKPMQKLLSKILRQSAFSYSKNVMKEEKEDKNRSRRVSFKIIVE